MVAPNHPTSFGAWARCPEWAAFTSSESSPARQHRRRVSRQAGPGSQAPNQALATGAATTVLGAGCVPHNRGRLRGFRITFGRHSVTTADCTQAGTHRPQTHTCACERECAYLHCDVQVCFAREIVAHRAPDVLHSFPTDVCAYWLDPTLRACLSLGRTRRAFARRTPRTCACEGICRVARRVAQRSQYRARALGSAYVLVPICCNCYSDSWPLRPAAGSI